MSSKTDEQNEVINVKKDKGSDKRVNNPTKKDLVDSERNLNSKAAKEDEALKKGGEPKLKRSITTKKTKFFEIFTSLITSSANFNTHSLALFSNSLALICFSFYLLDVAERDASIIAVEILFGGIVQTICGFIAITYGQPLIGYSSITTGNFWLVYPYIEICTYMFESIQPANKHSIGVFSTVFCVMYVFIFISSLWKSLILKKVYYLLMLIYQIFFTIGIWVEKKAVMQVSGAFCLAAGVLSFYVSCSMMINIIHRSNTMPLI